MANERHERRGGTRRAKNLGIEFDAATPRRRVGVSRDASAQGILVNTLNRFSPGEEVMVTIYGDNTSTRAKARIVRVEPMSAETRYPWRYLTAARFEEPVPELERLLESVAS